MGVATRHPQHPSKWGWGMDSSLIIAFGTAIITIIIMFISPLRIIIGAIIIRQDPLHHVPPSQPPVPMVPQDTLNQTSHPK